MKKILIVGYHLGLGGGCQRAMCELGNGLVEKGYDVKYLTIFDVEQEYDYIGENISMGLNKKANIITKIYYYLYMLFYIKRITQKYELDVAICFNTVLTVLLILSSCLGNSIRIIGRMDYLINEKGDQLSNFLVRCFYNKANKIVTNSFESIDYFMNNHGIKQDQIIAINNMLHLSKINKDKKESINNHENIFNNEKFTFINIGRLINQKNHQMLLKAFDQHYQDNPNSQLIILGKGPLEDKLKKQKKQLNSGQDIYFLGVHDNPYKFLANSDCFVFSSLHEGFANVLIEALACGLPVITTDHLTGAKELLRKNMQNFDKVFDVSLEEYGILVPNKNVEKMSQAMRKIYNNKKLQREYSERALERAKDFKVNKIIEEWEKIL